MVAVTCLLPSVIYFPNHAILAKNPENIAHLANTACRSLSSIQYGNNSTLFPLIAPTQSTIKIYIINFMLSNNNSDNLLTNLLSHITALMSRNAP